MTLEKFREFTKDLDPKTKILCMPHEESGEYFEHEIRIGKFYDNLNGGYFPCHGHEDEFDNVETAIKVGL